MVTIKICNISDLEISKNDVICKLNELHSKTDKNDKNDIKRTNNYLEWISQKTKMIIDEPSYVCENEKILIRGKVVWIDFGFNIGNEFGGKHPAIILRKTKDSVFVVPISSKRPNIINKYHVQIDKIYNFKDMERWINVLRVKQVSIQRIDFNSSIGNVKGHILDKISEAIKETYIF